MRLSTREPRRLKAAASCAVASFPRFGVNKRREIIRLLYEIAKRESLPPRSVLRDIGHRPYAGLKRALLERRYPHASLRKEPLTAYLPKLELPPEARASVPGRLCFAPRQIFVEEAAARSSLAGRVKEAFPRAAVTVIRSLKEHRRSGSAGGIRGYNQRRDTVFIAREQYDFFKRCPCTKAAAGCGYHIANIGFGCVYECAYCYLQEYTNSPGIILPVNIDDFFDRFKKYKRPGMRLGTGEFTDSLALDRLTGYSLPLVEFFKRERSVFFEFKTKSAGVGNLLAAGGTRNIVVSWSLNPQKVIEENELLTAPLAARLAAAAQCVAAGFRTGFHFDPVLCADGWEDEYAGVIDRLFRKVKARDIAWISVGSLRFSPALKQVIERRFPANTILDSELLPGYDGKLRYPDTLRREIYRKMLAMLRRHSRKVPIYLCMEQPAMWRALRLSMPRLS